MATPPAVPLSTYRLQLHAGFGFDAAAATVPYLKKLGITHLYSSPFLKARSGSTHGYDIVDHRHLNPEFGGVEAFDRLSNALAEAGIGLILDFVPNHMGVGLGDNEWWLDVLEWGQKSPYAPYFDIDWSASPYGRKGAVLLPILGCAYGEALRNGEIRFVYDAQSGSFSIWYYNHHLPIRPNRYGDILRTLVAAANAAEEEAGRRLLGLAARFPDPDAPSRDEAPSFKKDIAAVLGGAKVIERGMSAYRTTPDDSTRLLALHRLLERQHYRLAWWRVSVSEINYRRFFDINDLAGIRVEDQRAFTAIHPLVIQLLEKGRLQGIRLDHIDGLYDPAQYARRLQRATRAATQQPVYVVMEKILGDKEPCPRFAGMSGTTGYEWMNLIARVLIDAEGLPALEHTWREFTGERQSLGEILDASKILILDNYLNSEFTVLARMLARIAAGNWRTRDYTADRLRAALQAYVVNFPVYRTYVTRDGASTQDRRVIEGTIARARRRWFGADAAIFDFLQDVLTLDLIARERSGYSGGRVRRFALKVQQLTGPLMAKSYEDTALYRYLRLIALNEVGGEAADSGLDPDTFHRRMAARASEWPHSMTATATHDTKRGEDARARLLVLSEMPAEWSEAVQRWRVHNTNLITELEGQRAPSLSHEYLFYQTLLGAWPMHGLDATLIPRLQEYFIKAARESKTQTSWVQPDEAYEAALKNFVSRLLDADHSRSFIADFSGFAQNVQRVGALNSLTQLALKATLPGVPDFYQGTDLWDLALVDPDNRRPVDFAARNTLLEEIARGVDWSELAEHWTDGRIKLALTHALLRARHELREVFLSGDYRPLQARGAQANSVIAFSRTRGQQSIIVIVGRLMNRVSAGGAQWPGAQSWADTRMETDIVGPFHDVLRNRRVDDLQLAALFEFLPVAILRTDHDL